MSESAYLIHRAATPPPLDAGWDDPAWTNAGVAEITHFHEGPEASAHRPATAFRVLYDDDHLYLQFEVHDRYVRVVKHGHHAMVCRDSCVEFFFAPMPREQAAAMGAAYFNLETNAGGHQLMYRCKNQGEIEVYIPEEIDYEPVHESWMDRIAVWTSLPSRVEPEITEPTVWRAAMALPWALVHEVYGPIEIGPGAEWSGNFYKCGDETSHPHWASWRPIQSEPFRFHDPSSFGRLVFA
ncbi:MAG: carbohydrate-binding family 9-like protein [Planctomycetota bacterium]